MQTNKAKLLLQKYLSGNCTDEEKALVETWYLKQELDNLPDLSSSERQNDLDEITAKLEKAYKAPKPILFWPKVAAAAMVLFALSFGLYFYITNSYDVTKQSQNKQVYAQQIKPGGDKATLTLADGEKISLDDTEAGKLAVQSGIVITKTEDGQLIYTLSEADQSQKVGYNTIQTPRGGQYQISLPDGTKIWLNAASSLRYPTHFNGNKREVQLSGEAYFEVAKDKTKPFRVISDSQTIEVLGTHFNVNSYKDELSTKTTLLEGSVKVCIPNSDASVILKPGNQSTVKQQSINLKDVDTDATISWKNGQFMFVNESLGSIMRKISRWYDVDVFYKEDIADKTFSGAISKYTDVKEVLKTLELTKSVQFKVEGNTITASKK